MINWRATLRANNSLNMSNYEQWQLLTYGDVLPLQDDEEFENRITEEQKAHAWAEYIIQLRAIEETE